MVGCPFRARSVFKECQRGAKIVLPHDRKGEEGGEKKRCIDEVHGDPERFLVVKKQDVRTSAYRSSKNLALFLPVVPRFASDRSPLALCRLTIGA